MPEAHQKASDYQPQDTMYLWWVANPESPTLIGELNLVNRGHGVSLSYAPQWLQNGVPLSEDLPLQARLFLPEKSDTAAGAVDDARPDRWGERVIGALDEPKRLSLLEYLYFAGDHRFGALGVSLRADAYGSTPLSAPLSALPTLSEVGRIHDILMKVAAGEPVDEREKRLINPGRSMGGAKPKSLVEIDGVQWVLKFADEYDHDWPLIEHATMRLGKRAGIRMCETQAVPFASRRSAIAVRRFDRGVGGARFHCISAAVALRAAGETSGYPELASVFRRVLQSTLQGPARAELFRRMVFNIVCDNTDDHERNHALVLRDQGWELSDAFDVVPSMQNLRYQALRVGRDQLDATLENAMSECAAFGLSKDAASQIIRQVCKAVSGWRDVMREQGVHARDIEALEPSFEADKAAMRREFLRHAPSTRPSRQ